MTAFTLIELIVVMTLLVVVIGIALPTLGNFFRGRTLDSEARRLLALTRQGQSRAVSEGLTVVLWVDAQQRTYGLEVDSSFNERDSQAMNFTLDRDMRIEVVNVNVPRPAALAPATRSGGPSSGAAHHNLPQIRFLPDGGLAESSPQALRLLDRDGVSLWLAQSRNRLSYEIRNRNN